MEPQRVIALINEVMERTSDAIEAEGGVVDKYVGDEVMAVFGAPISRGDEPGRAVRAALRIRDEIEALNRGREARGEPRISMGIGINSGPAVAGNMGSSGRLNYTVLGESVNIASRLCDMAGGGEIVVIESILAELPGELDAVPLGERMFKGLSAPMQVYSIRGYRSATPAGGTEPSVAGAASTAARAGGVLAALLLALAGAAPRAAAQPLPTLRELGVAWSSADGVWQLAPSGRLEVDGYFPGEVPAGMLRTTHAFVAPGATLALDLFAGQRVYATVEARADRGEVPADRPLRVRVEQAFLRVTPLARANLSLQAGKFVTPFGAWPQRHVQGDAFIRPPLPYDYRTMVAACVLPGGPAGFVGWKNDPEIFRPIGAPPVWSAPYPSGVMLMAGWKSLGVRAAVLNSAPSSEPGEWNPDLHQRHGYSLVAHAGWQLSPELHLGVSLDHGPYLQDQWSGPMAPGHTLNDYQQTLWGMEAAFARGPLEARGELLLDRWEVPNLPGNAPRDVSFYAESRLKLTPGVFAAARYSGIRFNRVADGTGARQRWDYPADRLQLAAGYRLSRNTELRGEYLLASSSAPPEGGDDLLSLRWSWSF
jgi:class 3 adenylate cyclase